jgi:TonB family protein
MNCATRLCVFTAITALMTGAAAANPADTPPLRTAGIAGEYVIGGGPSRSDLKLGANGQFVMSSRSNLGTETEVSGEWSIQGQTLVLRRMKTGRAFYWILEVFERDGGYDLVPEETLQIYSASPSNIGTRYRRIAERTRNLAAANATNATQNRKSTAAAATPKVAIALSPSPSVSLSPRRSRAADTESSQLLWASSSATPANSPRQPPAAQSPSVGSAPPAAPLERAKFVYMPAPAGRSDPSLAVQPGLARMSLDARGNVTAVKILHSTGSRRFDAEAVETLSRWRAKPGEPRDVELPLTYVTTGKRAPIPGLMSAP